jgi:phage tail-like protein
MPAPTRSDPFKDYSFLVEIDGIPSAAFSEVSGLSAEAEVIEYREGSDKTTSSRKLPGRVRYGDVTLARGLTTSRDLFDWWMSVATGNVQRRNVAIILLDDARNEVLRWLLREAWVAKIEVGTMQAAGNDVLIEAVVLTHEGLELATAP